MPFAALDLIRVKGKYLKLTGGPASGTVSFDSSVVVVDAANNEIIFPAPFVVNLDGNGQFSIDIPATNDPDLAPVGWHYIVKEVINSSAVVREFKIEVPFSTPVDAGTGIRTLDMADVAPAVEVNIVTSYVLLNTYNADQATVNDAILTRASQAAHDAEVAARIAADDLRALLTDPRLTDQRVPPDGSVTGVKVAGAIKDPAAGVAGLRTLGVGEGQAAAGNDSRFSAVSGGFVFNVEGQYHRPSLISTAAFAFGAADFRLWLVDLPPGNIRSVALEAVTAGDAASRLRPLIYRPDGALGAPNSLLVDGGQLDSSTAGIKSLVVPTTVWAGGPVWVGAHVDAGTAPSLRYANGVAMQQVMPLATISTVNSSRNTWRSFSFPQGPAPVVFPGGVADTNPPIVAVECW